MNTLLVHEWMRTNVITINPELRVERAWELMERQRVRHLPVVQQGRLVGIVTERDLKRAVFGTPPVFTVWQGGKPQPTGTPGDLSVQTIMTREAATAKPTDRLLHVALRMLNEKIGALPVVNEADELVGMLTQTDLLKALVFLLQREDTSLPARENTMRTTMDTTHLDWFIDALHRQRALLVGEVADTEKELRSIQEEREIELEEFAQEDRAARALAQLDDRAKHEIGEIDAALQRVVEGIYGTCEECGNAIAEDRLRAVPATRFCLDCAAEQERVRPTVAPEQEARHPGRVSPDLSLLSDRELEEYIREQIREDRRVDMDELRLVCRHGVVHLAGALPSEVEHSILRQLLTDTLGLEEIVDHVQVQEVLWEREERTKVGPEAKPLPGQESYGTEDIVESLEEGSDYVPPIKPTPEEE